MAMSTTRSREVTHSTPPSSSSSASSVAIGGMAASGPLNTANIIHLPLEIIGHIIKCLPMSKEDYPTIPRINRLFRDAMQIIPKVIGFEVEIDERAEDYHSVRRIGPLIDVVGDEGTFEWNSNLLGENIWCLSIGICKVFLNPRAITRNPALLNEYIHEVVREEFFSQSMGPDVKVYSQTNLAVVSNDFAVLPEFWQQKLLPFINALASKDLEIPWFPSVFTHLKHVRTLSLLVNRNQWLSDPKESGFGSVNDSLEFKLPKLKEIGVSRLVCPRTLLRILENCPSVEDFSYVQLDRATYLTISLDTLGIPDCFSSFSRHFEQLRKLPLVLEERNVNLVKVTFIFDEDPDDDDSDIGNSTRGLAASSSSSSSSSSSILTSSSVSASVVSVATGEMGASRPLTTANITHLPLEIIGNIIRCMSMSTQVYKTIPHINRLFKNAMQIIPKSIGFKVQINQKVEDYDSFQRSDTLIELDVILSPRAISRNPASSVEYIHEMVRDMIFKQAMGPPVSDKFPVDPEFWQQRLLPFIDTLGSMDVEIPWFPNVFKYLKKARSLSLPANTDRRLPTRRSLRDLYPDYATVASEMAEFECFLSLEGICQLKNLRKLRLEECPVFGADFEFTFPRLKEMTVSYNVEDETFFQILENCPSLVAFKYVRIDNADAAFLYGNA
ncbi:hypothetical protein HDU76_005775, partial [Blyttiomyces sp. JEL0837]